MLTKFFKSELFSCLPKVGHVIKTCKEPVMQLIEPLARKLHKSFCAITALRTGLKGNPYNIMKVKYMLCRPEQTEL